MAPAKTRSKSREPAEGTGADTADINRDQAANANEVKDSRNGRRERGPDKEEHQARVKFEDAIKVELAAILERLGDSASTLEELRHRFPSFKLWTILSPDEQAELLEAEFKSKAYARTLTARQFAVSKEAIKKSRQISKRLRDNPRA
jgi:hypothetical protein